MTGGGTDLVAQPPIRVLFSSTSYPASQTDWKGLFILRLVEALAERDDLHLSLWAPPGPVPDRVSSLLSPEDERWLQALMEEGGIAHVMRQRPLSGLARAAGLLRRLRGALGRSQSDVLHLNWLQSALAVPARNRSPLLLTALGTDMRLLQLPGVRSALRRAFRRRPTIICPNAAWMVEPLSRAFGDLVRIEHVPFGIDPRWYAIQRQPQESPNLWLVVSRLTSAKLGPLFEWSAPSFSCGRRQLHLFGPKQESIDIPDWVNYHGAATPAELAADWFPFATGLITLSRHSEGSPQVMLEAMAAGLPIIASDMPAHTNLVQSRITGRLCHDAVGFATVLTELETPTVNTRCGAAAREWVSQHIGTWKDCASRYSTIYRELTKAGHG